MASMAIFNTNLKCAKHNASSKHVESHIDLLLQAGVLSAHHSSAVTFLSATVFYVKLFLLNCPIIDESLSKLTKVFNATY